jgi:hypothetical protein
MVPGEGFEPSLHFLGSPRRTARTGADGNPIHVGDQVQTRLNTPELATSDQRRVLNRDVWTVVGRCDDATVTAVHAGSRNATVRLTADYLHKHTVLAYATTIAGAQGRTVDAGHTVVTPRTDSAALYVGMSVAGCAITPTS